MESTRQQKVARLIQKELSNILIREGVNIYGRIMVSVTVVRMSPDLSVAKLYLSIFGTDKKKDVIKALDEAKGKLRYMLGQSMKVQMRVVPELIFYIDDSVDYFQKIDTLLKNLDKPKSTQPDDEEE
jgi:ribosome-binding factor A